MIPVEKCVERKLYRIRGRNFVLGVYCEKNKSFFGIRQKFGNEFVDEEFHWDTGAHYGTVKTLEELPETLPEAIVNQDDMGTECQVCKKKLNPFKEGAGWTHQEPTDCTAVSPMRMSNEALFNWLQEMEKKYPRKT